MGNALPECIPITTSVVEDDSNQTSHKHSNSDTDEFISQYGSYFSSATDDESSHSDSSSVGTTPARINAKSFSSSVPNTPIPMTPISPMVSPKCIVKQCESLRRIIDGLLWHAAIPTDYNPKYVIQMDDEYTEHMVDDYQHILMEHLHCMDAIKAEVTKLVPLCNPKACGAAKRYSDLNSTDILVSDCNDKQFFIYLMDLIHYYIFHSKCSK
eukprot:159264_1